MSARITALLLALGASAWGWAATSRDYPYLACFELASRLHHVPLELLLAVAATESNWDPDARSDANAHGIMQIQWPGTARHLGVQRLSELYNPCLNIELGARYLRELLDRNGGNVERTLAAYNYGPTRIASAEELPAGARRYVSTVNHHRARIEGNARKINRTTDLSAAVDFDSATRASRFARAIGNRVRNAEFVSRPAPHGGYSVSMHVKPQGLSVADLRVLEVFGWPGTGGG